MKLIKPIEVIKEIIARMRYSGDISAIESVTGGYKVTATNTDNLVLNEYVTIGSGEFKVIEIGNGFFKVATQPTGTTWTCQAPYFYHGTPDKIDPYRKVDMRLNELKFPFICVFEPISGEVNEGLQTEDCDLWLIFMSQCAKHFSQTDHENKIYDMHLLLNRFIESCQDSTDLINVSDELKYKITRHAQYGLVAKTKGHDSYLLNDDLTGIEIESFPIQIYADNCLT